MVTAASPQAGLWNACGRVWGEECIRSLSRRPWAIWGIYTGNILIHRPGICYGFVWIIVQRWKLFSRKGLCRGLKRVQRHHDGRERCAEGCMTSFRLLHGGVLGLCGLKSEIGEYETEVGHKLKLNFCSSWNQWCDYEGRYSINIGLTTALTRFSLNAGISKDTRRKMSGFWAICSTFTGTWLGVSSLLNVMMASPYATVKLVSGPRD